MAVRWCVRLLLLTPVGHSDRCFAVRVTLLAPPPLLCVGNTCTGNFRPGLNIATLQFLLRDSTVTITYRAMDLDSESSGVAGSRVVAMCCSQPCVDARRWQPCAAPVRDHQCPGAPPL